MDISGVALLSQNNSVSTSSTKCYDKDISVEETLLQHLQTAISETTEENVAYTKEITLLLNKLDFDVNTLPIDIKESLQKLSSILKSEGLFDFDETALQIVRERKIIEEKKQQREEKQMSLKYDKLFRNCNKLQTKLDNLQEAVESLRNDIGTTENNDMDCNKDFLSMKLKEYQQVFKKLETDLSDMQVNEFYSEEILNKYKEYLEQTSRLADLNQSLAQYGDLPPNLLQAKLLVENKRKEYKNLERMFLDKVQ
ncbi:hypothetical protein PUN28_001375 [Cardiocondyla obscurior]|uniref:Uncharacterized protein n=1 Tax=Cardiocondyla obscurior TaxID=286306 RepID=A0AAW2H504_9HYME